MTELFSFSPDSSKSILFVKLSEDALMCLEKYERMDGFTGSKSTIQFIGDKGVITIPGEDGVVSYDFSLSQMDANRSQGSFQCMEKSEEGELTSLGNIETKIQFHAKDASIEHTKSKIEAVDKKQKTYGAKVIRTASAAEATSSQGPHRRKPVPLLKKFLNRNLQRQIKGSISSLKHTDRREAVLLTPLPNKKHALEVSCSDVHAKKQRISHCSQKKSGVLSPTISIINGTKPDALADNKNKQGYRKRNSAEQLLDICTRTQKTNEMEKKPVLDNFIRHIPANDELKTGTTMPVDIERSKKKLKNRRKRRRQKLKNAKKLASIKAKRLAELEAKAKKYDLQVQKLDTLKEKKVAELEAKKLAELEARARKAALVTQRLADLGAKKMATLEAKKLATIEAKKLAILEAKELADLEAKKLADLEAKKLTELEARTRKAALETQRQDALQAKKLSDLEAKKQATLKAKKVAILEAKELADLEAKELVDLEAKTLVDFKAKKLAELELRTRKVDLEAQRLDALVVSSQVPFNTVLKSQKCTLSGTKAMKDSCSQSANESFIPLIKIEKQTSEIKNSLKPQSALLTRKSSVTAAQNDWSKDPDSIQSNTQELSKYHILYALGFLAPPKNTKTEVIKESQPCVKDGCEVTSTTEKKRNCSPISTDDAADKCSDPVDISVQDYLDYKEFQTIKDREECRNQYAKYLEEYYRLRADLEISRQYLESLEHTMTIHEAISPVFKELEDKYLETFASDKKRYARCLTLSNELSHLYDLLCKFDSKLKTQLL